MTDVSREVRAAYDRIVGAYAERNDGAIPPALIPYAEELLERVGASARIVDIGCGTGRDMAWFEARGVRVTGIDISIEMLKRARGKVRGDLMAMQMSRLGIRDNAFDAAWCCASLLHLPKPEAKRALGEIRRVLGSGSPMMLSLQEGSGEGWEGGYVADVQRFFARYSVDELRVLLASTGFSVGDIRSFPGDGHDWLVSVCIAE